MAIDILQNSKTVTVPPLGGEGVRGAEIVIHSLLAENVETIFGYPGGAIMPIYDALYDFQDRIKHILVRHEQGAVHAAQGYARVCGKVGVVFATSGPGATNLITGIADALVDSTPLVCITGQVASPLLGTDAFQEADVMNTTVPVTKWNVQVTRAEDIASAIAKAFYIARTGRPGPVLIDITKDAQFALADFDYETCESLNSYHPVPAISEAAIDDAAILINTAKRPYILCGQGVTLSNASEELVALAEKANIPVACTLLGLSAFPDTHPLYVGYLGMHGNYAPNINTNECDVLIAVGMRFDDRVTGDLKKYAKQAKIIHIDLDASEINKLVKVEVGIHADAKQALQVLNKKIISAKHDEWLNSFKDLYRQEFEQIISKNLQSQNDSIQMGMVIHELNKVTKGDAIIVTDVGQHQMVASRYAKFNKKRSNVTSGGMGTMGFALPAAMGAKLGREDQVVAIIGDGGIQMTIQELGTIAQYKIPVKIVLLNNNFLGMVRQWQQLFFDKRYSFVDMVNPDFIKLADAYGIKAKKTANAHELSAALQEMWDHDGPYFLEVVVEKEENVFPMMPTGAGVNEIKLS